MSREILFEFQPMGSVVRVSAVDAQTGVEVTIVGASSASQNTLQAVASRKLAYVLKKQSGQAQRLGRML